MPQTSTEVPEVRGSSGGQGVGRISEALLILSHAWNFGAARIEPKAGVEECFPCRGEIGDSRRARRLSRTKGKSAPFLPPASSFL